jgi:uncharacterized YigZ family protein
MDDVYKTIVTPSEETLFKDRNSKFFGYAFPVRSEEDVKEALELLKKKHHSARHFCYAWQLGVEKIRFRANDDGEPSNSAGMPIYGQIQSFAITNVLIVSVRYFGGTKLGVGGLINAYRTSARLALEASTIVEKTVDVSFRLNFGYDLMSKVMKIIKEQQLEIQSQTMEMDCELEISVRKSKAVEIFEIFNNIYKLEIRQLEV